MLGDESVCLYRQKNISGIVIGILSLFNACFKFDAMLTDNAQAN